MVYYYTVHSFRLKILCPDNGGWGSRKGRFTLRVHPKQGSELYEMRLKSVVEFRAIDVHPRMQPRVALYPHTNWLLPCCICYVVMLIPQGNKRIKVPLIEFLPSSPSNAKKVGGNSFMSFCHLQARGIIIRVFSSSFFIVPYIWVE